MIEAYRATSACGTKLAVDQIGSLCDDQGGGDQGSVVTFEEGPARSVVIVRPIRRSDQRAGVNDEHASVISGSVAPETLGQHLVSLSRAPVTRGCADPGKRQVPP
jgi:hypothetical protein